MSSADSSVLSAASMFAHNIWQLTIRPNVISSEAPIILVKLFEVFLSLVERRLRRSFYSLHKKFTSQSENAVKYNLSKPSHNDAVSQIKTSLTCIVMKRLIVAAVGALATLMALTINSIYGLWYLCADLVYVILFPQLVCVVYFSHSNTYGSISGYAVGLLLRLSGGEPLLAFPAFVHYPMYEETINPDGSVNGTQYFPFRTMSMLGSFATCLGVSYIAEYLFNTGKLPMELDVFKCIVDIPSERIALQSDISFNASTEILNAHKMRDHNDHHFGDSLRASDASPATEFSTLFTNENKDYLTLNKN